MTLCATVKETWNNSKKYVNYKLGSVSGGTLGAYVYYVNSDHGVIPAGLAALKQFSLSLLLGGTVIKLGQHVTIRPKSDILGCIGGVVVPSAVASAIVFGIHYFTGTPEPYLSTIPYPALAVMATTPVSYFTRRTYNKPEDERTNFDRLWTV